MSSSSKPAPQLTSPTPEQVAEALRQVVGNLVRKVRSEAHTPSSAQSETLGYLDRNGPTSISELAAHRHVKHQSMRLVVAQLETQQLVARAPDPGDGRKQLITLTEVGRATLEAGRALRSDWLAGELKRSTTATQLQTLSTAVKILEKLLDAEAQAPSS